MYDSWFIPGTLVSMTVASTGIWGHWPTCILFDDVGGVIMISSGHQKQDSAQKRLHHVQVPFNIGNFVGLEATRYLAGIATYRSLV